MVSSPTRSPNAPVVVFDIDGVVRDVSHSYRRALADTVEHFTAGTFRPTMADIDELKSEGVWNNDWLGSQELVYRYFESQGRDRQSMDIDYETVVDFFQKQYRGPNPEDASTWTGYIRDEPLLATPEYLESLTAAGIAWGFFSGATPGSANYVLGDRLQIKNPVLVAMGDAPDKPDPTGLFQVLERLTIQPDDAVVVYVGDTVADIQTVLQAREARPQVKCFAVGIVPPHAWGDKDVHRKYEQTLQDKGADWVCDRITDLTPAVLQEIIQQA
ncbi:MAG: TIGR01548 family HAD-type hydrolase [Cyanobacteria bacterium P01_D01_bin.73]